MIANESALEDVQVSTSVFKAIAPFTDLGSLLIEDFDIFDVQKFKQNDGNLLDVTRDNVQFLLNKVWDLPTQRVHDIIVAQMPKAIIRVPREKPVPKEKRLTKWQEYAKVKGINKRKKPRTIWDDQTQSWKPRWGYKRGNDESKDWVVEIPHQKDPYNDYIEERLTKKKEKVAKNQLQRLRNIARAGDTNVHTALPLQQRTTQDLLRVGELAKSATASHGRFVEKLAKEKSPKTPRKKNRQFEANELASRSEVERQLNVLQKIQTGKPKLNPEARLPRDKDQSELAQDDAPSSRSKKKAKRPSKADARKKGSKRRSKMQHANKERFKMKRKNKR